MVVIFGKNCRGFLEKVVIGLHFWVDMIKKEKGSDSIPNSHSQILVQYSN